MAAWLWAAVVAVDDRRHLHALTDAEPSDADGLVSVVVAARNEAGRMDGALRSLERQAYSQLEVIVVDDESEDATYEEARRHTSPRIEVLRGEPLPPGWVGKSWANHQGAQAARGDWLLFTDADVIHEPAAIRLAVDLARRLGGPGLTVLPRLETATPSERIVQPAAAVLISSFVTPGPFVRGRSSTAIAAGGFILLRREAYDAIGGHEAIRDRLVDDKALAERVKAVLGRLELVDGGGLVRVRMYHGLGELWRGWRKNTSIGVAESSPLLGALAAGTGAVLAVAPWVAAARGPRLAGLGGIALQLAVRWNAERFAPTPLTYRATLPLGCLFLAAVSLTSSVDRLRGGVAWRGRVYATRSGSRPGVRSCLPASGHVRMPAIKT